MANHPTSLTAAPAFSSSLDPSKQSHIDLPEQLATADYGRKEFDLPQSTHVERLFRHSGHAHRRRVVYQALRDTGQTSARINRFATCGSSAWVQSNGREYRVVCNRCRDRLCPACAAERGARIAGRLRELIKDREPRFVTLTLRCNLLPLGDQISRLYDCFGRLRRRHWWKDHVQGGAAVCEVKLGRTGAWHVHLHMLVSSDFIPQAELSQEWYRVTGDSSIVDVRAIRPGQSGADLAGYLAKYLAKPMSHDVLAVPDRMRELIGALKGRRVCFTWGNWRGEKLDELSEDAADGNWTNVASLEHVLQRAKMGDTDCKRIVEILGKKRPCLLYLIGASPPR